VEKNEREDLKPLFELGQLVGTPGVLQTLIELEKNLV
jgi:hypothetical protein